jgi:hypothetical protein
MALKTLAQIRTHARLLAGDSATSTTGRTDADYNEYIDEAYSFVWSFYGPRLFELGATNDTNLDTDMEGAGAYVVTLSTQNIDEIMGVFFESSAPDTERNYSLPLEPISYAELAFLRSQSTTNSGSPQYYCVLRSQETAGPTTVFIHPPLTAGENNFTILTREHPDAIGDSSYLDVTPAEEYLVARLAALEAMRTIGERMPSRWNVVAMMVPEEMRAARGIKLYADIGVSSMDVGA